VLLLSVTVPKYILLNLCSGEVYASKVGLHLNTGKTKLVQIGVFDGEEVNAIQAAGGEIESDSHNYRISMECSY